MGSVFSCISAQDDRRHAERIITPLPSSHLNSEPHRSYPSMIKSISSSYEKDHFRHDSDPHSYMLPPAQSLPVITTSHPRYHLRPPLSAPRHEAQLRSLGEQAAAAYSTFVRAYPEYQNTWIVDTLRRTDFSRFDRLGETYVDYMGGSQHPECLVRAHSDFLTQNIMGNTHSVSNR